MIILVLDFFFFLVEKSLFFSCCIKLRNMKIMKLFFFLICRLWVSPFCRHFYNIKCLRNTYFICSINFVEYEIGVSFYFHKKNIKKIVLSFAPPDSNLGSILGNWWSLQMLPSAKGAFKEGLYVYSWLKSYKKIGAKIDVYNWGKLREFSSWDVSKFPVVTRIFWNMISFVKFFKIQ